MKLRDQGPQVKIPVRMLVDHKLYLRRMFSGAANLLSISSWLFCRSLKPGRSKLNSSFFCPTCFSSHAPLASEWHRHPPGRDVLGHLCIFPPRLHPHANNHQDLSNSSPLPGAISGHHRLPPNWDPCFQSSSCPICSSVGNQGWILKWTIYYILCFPALLRYNDI